MIITFKEHLADLQNGLKLIQKKIDYPKDLNQQNKARAALETQKIRIQFLKIGYHIVKNELEEQKTLNSIKPVHISVIANKDDSVDTAFYFKDATVCQLSMINHEIDILKTEIIDRIKNAPKEYELEDWGEENP